MALLTMPKRGPYKPGASIKARALASGIPLSTIKGRMHSEGMTLDEAIAAGIRRPANKTHHSQETRRETLQQAIQD